MIVLCSYRSVSQTSGQKDYWIKLSLPMLSLFLAFLIILFCEMVFYYCNDDKHPLYNVRKRCSLFIIALRAIFLVAAVIPFFQLQPDLGSMTTLKLCSISTLAIFTFFQVIMLFYYLAINFWAFSMNDWILTFFYWLSVVFNVIF